MAKDEIGHDMSPTHTSDMIEGPAGFCGFQGSVPHARAMPTWHAPASGPLAADAERKQPVDIAGPAHPGYASLPTTKGKAEE